MVITTPAPQPTDDQNAADLPTPPLLRPPRRRPSKLLILAGVVLSALSSVGAVQVLNSQGLTVPAVGVAHAVLYGQTITESALTEVRVHPDPGVHALPWDQREQLLGRTATTDLLPGEIVTAQAVQGPAELAPDQVLVGVAVKPAQFPATPLQPRQPVLLVPSGQSGDAEVWQPVPAMVLRTGDQDSTGIRVVDVIVSRRSGPSIATRASAGGVAIVVLPPGS